MNEQLVSYTRLLAELGTVEGPYSYDLKTGDGVAVTFPFAFVGITGPEGREAYLRDSDIAVYTRDANPESPNYNLWYPMDGVLTFPAHNMVTLPIAVLAPVDGQSNIRINREMPRGAPYFLIPSDAIFRKEILNNSFIQQLYLMHEVLDDSVAVVEEMTASAETIDYGVPATADWNPESRNMHFGIPEGRQGIQGIQGIQGPEGIQGPIGVQGETGIQGPLGPEGPVGPEGIQGPIGVDGPVGPLGPTGSTGPQGPQGDSMQIDAVGLLEDRDLYDDELAGFSYYASDSFYGDEGEAIYETFTGDGTTLTFPITHEETANAASIVTLGGSIQEPILYEVDRDAMTITFATAPVLDIFGQIRTVTAITGEGSLYVKRSDTSGDWHDGIPFGRGPQGALGPIGPTGPTGDQGPEGIQGPEGAIGPTGAQGPTGQQGEVGPEGIQGPEGDRGPDGIQGPEGEVGPTGDTGATGNQGIAGPAGPEGDQGPAGATGPTGDTGLAGPQGVQGIAGEAGGPGPIGPDGASGRSSSGDLFDCPNLIYSPGQTRTQFTFTVNVAQSFERVVKISGMLGLAAGTGTIGTFRPRVNYAGGTEYQGGRVGQDEELYPVMVPIPANTTGLVTVQVYYSSGVSSSGQVRGIYDIDGEKALVELFPASLELIP